MSLNEIFLVLEKNPEVLISLLLSVTLTTETTYKRHRSPFDISWMDCVSVHNKFQSAASDCRLDSHFAASVVFFGLKINRSPKLYTRGKVRILRCSTVNPPPPRDVVTIHLSVFMITIHNSNKSLFCQSMRTVLSFRQSCRYSNPVVSVISRCKYLATACVCTPGYTQPLWMLVCAKAPQETEPCASYHGSAYYPGLRVAGEGDVGYPERW